MEIRISLQPRQRKALQTADSVPITFMGGAKGGGKSHLVRAREVIRRLRYPNTKGLIIRKTYPELIANHVRPFFKDYPQTRNWYNKAEKTIYWPNGSTTEFSYLRNTDDVYTYQGREYDDMAIDEITQHEWEVVTILKSSLRTTIRGFKPSLLLTGNPGGIGHQEVKRIFIDRNFREGEKPEDYAFVPAFVQDNQALMDADPGYVDRLKTLPEHLVKAYLYGDWNIFAGQAFENLSRDIHLIEPKKLSDRATWFAGYDYGHTHPFSFVLCGYDVDNTVYVTAIASAVKTGLDEQANIINNIVGDKKINVFAGVDIWAVRGGPKIVDTLRNKTPNLAWVKAYVDRVNGVARMRELIGYKGDEDARIKIFKNASRVYEQLLAMQYDEKKPEDVLKVNANEYGVGGDDIFDATRYAVATYFKTLDPKPKKKEINTGQAILDMIEDEERLERSLGYF